MRTIVESFTNEAIEQRTLPIITKELVRDEMDFSL